MASRALTAKLTITCSNCEMSTLTGHRSRPCTTSSVTFSPISRLSSMPRSLSVSPRSSTCGRKVCLRENASSWRTSAAARLAFCLIWIMSWNDGSVGFMMADSTLLKSWDAAGKLADRFHLLLLNDTVFQRALRRDFQRIDDARLAVAIFFLDRGNKEARPALLAA